MQDPQDPPESQHGESSNPYQVRVCGTHMSQTGSFVHTLTSRLQQVAPAKKATLTHSIMLSTPEIWL